MEMPPINRCFDMFPPKYGCYLISLFGMGTGGIGLAVIVLFGIVERQIVRHFTQSENLDMSLKKMILLTVGISSLLLTVGNVLLFLGVTTSKRGLVASAKWVLFTMCMLILLECIGAPVSCFFIPETCIIKQFSFTGIIFSYLILTLYVEVWLYFMVVAYNLQQEL